MAYPYTNQSITESKKDSTTGRLLLIDDPTIFTPRELLKFIDEGFIPVAVALPPDASVGASFGFARWALIDGLYMLDLGGSDTYASEDLDTPFSLSQN